MSTSAPEVDEQLLEGETDVLELHRTTGVLQESSIERAPNGKGVDAIVTLIEEGWGNERDGHYYGEDELREALPLFNTGRSKCYINHLTPAQRQALRGVPRDPREHGARILKESAFMGTGPNGKPAINARIRIAHPLIAYMVEADPEALELSIDARGRAEDFTESASGRSGRRVKKITRVLSTDFVTEAGANGQINELLTEGDPLMVEAFVEAQREQGAGMADSSVLDGAADELHEQEQGAGADTSGGDTGGASGSSEPQWEPVDMEEGDYDEEEFEELSAEELTELLEADEDELEEGAARAGVFAGTGELEHSKKDTVRRKGHLNAGVPYNVAEDHRHEIPEEPASARHLHSHTRGGHRRRGRDQSRGLGEMRENEQMVEGEAGSELIEARALELAEQMVDERLDEALAAGLQTQREQFEAQLREVNARNEKALTIVRQGHEVARLVENARLKGDKPLPAGSQRALKETYFEHLFEAELNDKNEVVKPASEVLRETVLRAIAEKVGEVTEFREARVTDAGPTAGETLQESKAPRTGPGGRRRRKGRELDKSVDREIGLS
jgi:hypothetical protein